MNLIISSLKWNQSIIIIQAGVAFIIWVNDKFCIVAATDI